MKKYIVIAVLSLSCFTSVAQNITLVPFNKAQHDAQAARIFKEHFRSPSFAELVADNIATIKICMLDNKVIGVLAYKKVDINHNRHLYYFAIDTQYQSKGYGTACMKQFEQRSRQEGVTTITLDPSTDISTKDPSRFFKEKLHYQPINARSTTLTKNIASPNQ